MLDDERLVAELLRRAGARTAYAWVPDVELAMARGSRRRLRVRRTVAASSALVAGTVLIAAVALVGPAVFDGDAVAPADVANVPLTVSALTGEPVIEGPLTPTGIVQGVGEGEDAGVLVYDDQEYPSFQVRLSLGPDDQVCVGQVSPSYGAGAGRQCAPRSSLLDEGVVFVAAWPDQTFKTVVVLPDGYSQVSLGGDVASVEDNVAVLTDEELPQGELMVSGPEVPTVQWPTANFWGAPERWEGVFD